MGTKGFLIGLMAVGTLAGCYRSFPRNDYDCGNGVVEPPEQCDDGNDDDCDGCKANCTWSRALHVGGGDLGATVAQASVPCLPCPFTLESWFEEDDDLGFWDLYDIPSYSHSTFGAHAFDLQAILGGTSSGGYWEGFAPGTWHHWAISCWRVEEGGDEWSQYSYIDGEVGGGSTTTERPATCTGPMSIGDALSSVSGGSIDDLRFSDQALYPGPHDFTPRRRLALRDDTVALWDFDEEFLGTLRDASGNGHDALLVDGTLVRDDCHQP